MTMYRLKEMLTDEEWIKLFDLLDIVISESIVEKMPNPDKFEIKKEYFNALQWKSK